MAPLLSASNSSDFLWHLRLSITSRSELSVQVKIRAETEEQQMPNGEE